jgi:hypothetical protein
MVATTPLLIAAATAFVLLLAGVAGAAVRAGRSPRSTVRAMAQRRTPIGQIAKRTGLPQDVVRALLGTMEQLPANRQTPLRREASAAPPRPRPAVARRIARIPAPARAAASR